MAAFQKFLIQHVEKVVLVVVTVLCLLAVFGIINRRTDATKIEYEGGETPYEINTGNVDSYERNINNHLLSADASVQFPPTENLHGKIIDSVKNPELLMVKYSPQWVLYTRPPSTDITWGVTRTGAGQADPPAEFITGVAPPLEWEIIASPRGILVMAMGPEKGEHSVRWAAEDLVELALVRTEVDSIRDDLNTNVSQLFTRRNSLDPSIDTAAIIEGNKPTTKAPAESFDAPQDPDMPQPAASKRPVYTRPQPQPQPSSPDAPPQASTSASVWDRYRMPGSEDVASEAVSPTKLVDLLTELREINRDSDQAMLNELVPMRGASGAGDPGWVIVAERMEAYEEPFNEKAIQEILRTGELPPGLRPAKWFVATEAKPEGEGAAAEPAGGDASAAESSSAASGSAPAAPATPATPARPVGAALPKFDEYGLPIEQAEAGIAEAGPVAAPDEIDKYEPRFFAFFDKRGIRENAVYRYRFAAFTQARDLPARYRARPEYAAYPPRAELSDVTVRDAAHAPHPATDVAKGYFAYTAEEFREYARASEKDDSAKALLIPPELMEWDEKLGILKGMVFRESASPTKRATAYRRGDRVYSRWMYSSIVVVPQAKKFQVRGAMPTADGSFDVSFEVETLVDGRIVKNGFRNLRPPEAVRNLTWRNWLKTAAPAGAGGQPALVIDPETGQYAQHPYSDLAAFYAQAGRFAATPIGAVATRGKQEIDFRTNWGLVDVRDARVTRQRVKPNDGSPVGRPQVRTGRYVVIRELEAPAGRDPQYRRLLVGVPAKRVDEVEEIEWEPTLADEQAKLRQQRDVGGAAQTPAAN